MNRLASRHRGRRPVGDRLIDRLIDQGVLASDERRVLGLVPRRQRQRLSSSCSVEPDIVLTS